MVAVVLSERRGAMVDVYLLIVEIVEAVTMVTELLLDVLDRRHKKSDRHNSRKD